MNLTTNAVKFTERGEICVHASLESSDESSITIHWIVRDTGIGIPAEKQQAIFGAFTQADASTTRKHGGTGLGLTISARLVKMMGGRIWVESEPDKGSRFHFTTQFGVASCAQETSVPPAWIAPITRDSAPEHRAGLHILVAEDNAVNQQLVRRLLEKHDHAVTIVNNGQEAVRAIEQETFDLVLMDVQMPEMDGLEATTTIRKLENGTGKHQRIVAMTAHAMTGDRERCLAGGMDGYLSKPIRPHELIELTARLQAELGASLERG